MFRIAYYFSINDKQYPQYTSDIKKILNRTSKINEQWK